jgi:transcription initiation factor TFIID subunit 11
MNTQQSRTASNVPSSTPQNILPRKRSLAVSTNPVRPPPNLRTSNPTTPQPVKEEDDEDDGKDDYGDIGVNSGETRDEETKEERERIKYDPGNCIINSRILLETFTPEQMQRYEVFRRANLNKSGVKKVQILTHAQNNW